MSENTLDVVSDSTVGAPEAPKGAMEVYTAAEAQAEKARFAADQASLVQSSPVVEAGDDMVSPAPEIIEDSTEELAADEQPSEKVVDESPKADADKAELAAFRKAKADAEAATKVVVKEPEPQLSIEDLATIADDEKNALVAEFLADPIAAQTKINAKIAEASAKATASRKAAAKVANTALKVIHSDADTISSDTQYHEFINASPLRQKLAMEAISNLDHQTAGELIAWYKQSKGITKGADEAGVAKAAAVAMASAGVAGGARQSASTGKTLSRKSLRDLNATNPEAYAARSAEIETAYAEGRIRD